MRVKSLREEIIEIQLGEPAGEVPLLDLEHIHFVLRQRANQNGYQR